MTTRKTILIVDDEADILKVVTARIARLGYGTLTAASGIEALAVVNAHRPDLILLDVQMPKMDGYAVHAELKMTSSTADIPIVFLTAASDIERSEAYQKLANPDVLIKPFTTEQLTEKLAKYLAQ